MRGTAAGTAELATNHLQEDELEVVDRREAWQGRAEAAIWKRTCSERGGGPRTGRSGRDSGHEGNGFGVETLRDESRQDWELIEEDWDGHMAGMFYRRETWVMVDEKERVRVRVKDKRR